MSVMGSQQKYVPELLQYSLRLQITVVESLQPETSCLEPPNVYWCS